MFTGKKIYNLFNNTQISRTISFTTNLIITIDL